MTVKCGADFVPGLSIKQLLFSTNMDLGKNADNCSTESKKFDKLFRPHHVEDEPKKSPNSSGRLSFSVDSLLSSIRRNKEPAAADQEPDKPDLESDLPVNPELEDDEELDVEGEEDSDDYVEDDEETETGSNRFSNQVFIHPSSIL